MAAVSAAKSAHATLSTTVADTVTLTSPVKNVRVTNHHATVVLYVTVKRGRTAAGAVGATTAVAQADETIGIPPYQSKIVASGERKLYTELSVVGNANPYSVEGQDAPFVGNG